MILSNLTTPIMGLVDTAVLGHLDSTYYLAGASVSALFITQLYWLCGFLRMTSTGLSGQALGENDVAKANKTLVQGLYLSVLLAVAILFTQNLWLKLVVLLANAQPAVVDVIQDYFSVRIWGAPAALANLVLIGWLIGQQRAGVVMWIQILGNLINAVLSVYLVVYWQLDVRGVALATIIAEYAIMGLSLRASKNIVGQLSFEPSWFKLTSLRQLLALNGHSFVRNITLQLCLAFLVFQGMRYGATSAAINAILLQFFSLIALGLDGVAYSAEALVGEQLGKKSATGIARVTSQSLVWSLVFAMGYSAVFYVFGNDIIAMLTTHTDLQMAASPYLPIIALLPLFAHWCFLLDGVFIGLTRAKAMRNSMLLSAIGIYVPLWLLFSYQQNQGMWLALLGFLLARGMTLGAYFIYLYRIKKLVV
ncbi:MATE family efflux transporter [Paraglaciecola sp.]|uniref:MATE family efflux transporter n=1 Tax=Paraglaciecola sp. TaxID=1920173 RepID=UPI00273F5B34|nr:MATE family efflux transporter [Paraglaciecola sp.]MDP5029856.1 MATE family efflux transporter [Paraglaciecola sp.]